MLQMRPAVFWLGNIDIGSQMHETEIEDPDMQFRCHSEQSFFLSMQSGNIL